MAKRSLVLLIASLATVLAFNVFSSDGESYADAASLTPTTTFTAPANLAFGNVTVGNTVTKRLTVKNSGNGLLFISGVTSTDPSEFAPTAWTCPPVGLAPGRTCWIAVRFTPNT